MTEDLTQFNQPIPPKSVCSHCEENHSALRRCCLTGMGDHPRYFLLCDECIQKIVAKSPSVARSRQPSSPTMSEKEKRFETRRQKTLDRLGTDHPICACCSETDWRCMELHHLEGEDFGKTLVIVCRNCHRKLSDMQKDHPSKFAGSPTTLESIGHFLLGLADLMLLLVNKLCEFGEYLIEQARLQSLKKKPSRS